jgi:hypothetical protein
VTDGDLAEARAELVEDHKNLEWSSGDITDEQVRKRAVHRLLMDAPERLDLDELRQLWDALRTRVKKLEGMDLSFMDKDAARSAVLPRITAAMGELDRRGELIDNGPDAPPPGDARRDWAVARIATLGALRDYGLPFGVDDWLEEMAAATWKVAGDDAPSRSAVTKACVRWSWSRKSVELIHDRAFPPPPPRPAQLAQRRREYDLIHAVAARAQELRGAGRPDAADQLVASAKEFLTL